MAKVRYNEHIVELEIRSDQVLLKDVRNDSLYFLNATAYEIVKIYGKINSIKKIKEWLKAQFGREVSSIEIINVIEYAREKDILTKQEPSSKVYSKYENILLYLHTLLKLDRFNIDLSLKGDFKFYRICCVKLRDNRLLDRLFNNKLISYALLVVPFISILSAIWLFNSLPQGGVQTFKDIYLTSLFKTGLPFSLFLILTALCSSLVLMFHEYGHYFVYKAFKGKKAELGLALIHYMFPVAYVSVNSVYFWRGKKGTIKKILVSLSGVYFDLFAVSLMLWTLYYTHNTYHSLALILVTVIAVVIGRIILSLNPFLAFSDGYFVMSDLLGKEKIFEKATKEFEKLKEFKKYKSKLNNFRSISLLSYLFLATGFVVCYWVFMIYFLYQLIQIMW